MLNLACLLLLSFSFPVGAKESSCYDPNPTTGEITARQLRRCDDSRARGVTNRIEELRSQIALRDLRVATTGITYDMTLFLNETNSVGPLIEELEKHTLEAETLTILAEAEADSDQQKELEALIQPLPELRPLTQIRDRRSMEILRREYLSQFDNRVLQTKKASVREQNPSVSESINPKSVGASFCSAGGFISKLKAPTPPQPVTAEMRVALQRTIYDRDCQTPTKTRLLFRGQVYDIQCMESKSSPMDLINMCHPLFFGFFPTQSANKKSTWGVGLCHLPSEVTFSTGQRQVEQTNRQCGVLSDGFLAPRLEPLYEGRDKASLQMAAELARDNPELWQRSLQQIKAHCQSDIRRSHKTQERTSCDSLLQRIQAIQALQPTQIEESSVETRH